MVVSFFVIVYEHSFKIHEVHTGFNNPYDTVYNAKSDKNDYYDTNGGTFSSLFRNERTIKRAFKPFNKLYHRKQ